MVRSRKNIIYCPLSIYGKKYGGADPELIEGDIFRMIIKVPEFGGKAELSEETGKVGEQVGEQVKSALESLKQGAKSKQELFTANGDFPLHARRYLCQACIRPESTSGSG